MRSERAARGWSQAQAAAVLAAHARGKAPGRDTLIRNWKRWESGGATPDDFYRPLIAQTFGTVTDAFFPPDRAARAASKLPSATGMDALEVLARLHASDVSPATLDAVRHTADELCTQYPHRPSETLRADGAQWLSRITGLLDQRVSLKQRRELLDAAATVALVLGCVEYDMRHRQRAEAARREALSLAEEVGDTAQMAWAFEMRAWFDLTQNNYRGVLDAAQAGIDIAPSSQAAVQLTAQQAKAWARLGDRRQVELALDRGRTMLERLPYPENLDHHFVVDPEKFDFYAMDCYRVVGENQLAATYAQEVARTSTGPDGSVAKPMRLAEAQLTLGVVSARSGDLDGAVAHGIEALSGDRKSLPSLLLASRELVSTLDVRYGGEPKATAFVDRVRELAS